MKRDHFLYTIIVLIASISIVGALYSLSDRKPNHRYASFTRNFEGVTLLPVDTLDLGNTGYYFAGHTELTVYLANTRRPGSIMTIGRNFQDTTHTRVVIDHDSLAYRALAVKVDSPYFYLLDGTIPFIYRGTLESKTASQWITDTGFSTAIPFGNFVAFVVIRNLENTLARRTPDGTVETFPEILEEQGDGIFSTDGMFQYSKARATFVYVYYYRNQYIEADTSFRSVTRGNTIDTITTAKIVTRNIRSENTLTMAAPPLQVNLQSAVSDNHLLIQSNLLSKTEDIGAFETQSVIDVYDLNTKRYRYSFYIPAQQGKKVREFLLARDTILLARYEKSIVKYKVGTKSQSVKKLRNNSAM